MLIIIDTRTNQRVTVGAWLSRSTCEEALARIKRTRPDLADHVEIKEIE